MKSLIKQARKLAKPFRVTDDSFRLKDIDPGDTLEFTSEDKPRAKEALAMGIGLLAELQDMLYAQDRCNGVAVRKFFLHVSNKEQRKRFLSRIEEPEKNWKFSANDAKERAYWDDYMAAYEDVIRNTATKRAPWYVVPADNKWFTRVVVAAAVIEVLASLNLAYPTVSEAKLKDLAVVKRSLVAGK